MASPKAVRAQFNQQQVTIGLPHAKPQYRTGALQAVMVANAQQLQDARRDLRPTGQPPIDSTHTGTTDLGKIQPTDNKLPGPPPRPPKSTGEALKRLMAVENDDDAEEAPVSTIATVIQPPAQPSTRATKLSPTPVPDSPVAATVSGLTSLIQHLELLKTQLDIKHQALLSEHVASGVRQADPATYSNQAKAQTLLISYEFALSDAANKLSQFSVNPTEYQESLSRLNLAATGKKLSSEHAQQLPQLKANIDHQQFVQAVTQYNAALDKYCLAKAAFNSEDRPQATSARAERKTGFMQGVFGKKETSTTLAKLESMAESCKTLSDNAAALLHHIGNTKIGEYSLRGYLTYFQTLSSQEQQSLKETQTLQEFMQGTTVTTLVDICEKMEQQIQQQPACFSDIKHSKLADGITQASKPTKRPEEANAFMLDIKLFSKTQALAQLSYEIDTLTEKSAALKTKITENKSDTVSAGELLTISASLTRKQDAKTQLEREIAEINKAQDIQSIEEFDYTGAELQQAGWRTDDATFKEARDIK